MRTPNLDKKRKKKRQLNFLLFLLLASVLFGAAFHLSRLQSLKITKIVVAGNSIVSADDIRAIASTHLDGYYAGLFPHSNSYIYPKDEIKKQILEAFKRVKEVSIGVEDSKTLHIDIVERKPWAMWCEEATEEKPSKCHFIDDQGVVFAEAPNFEGTVFLRYYGALHNGSLLSPDILGGLNTFAHSVGNIGIIAESVKVVSEGQYEMTIDEGGKVLFSNKVPYDVSLSNLSTVLSSLPSGAKSIHLLDYIDLRFGNKVFYKVKRDDSVQEI